MRAKKDENGFMSAESQNNRFLNFLQLIYLGAEKAHGDGHFITNDLMEKIETELDFNTTLTTKKSIIEEQKKKYRKRKSYLFWMDILSNGNYDNYNSARGVLMSIHEKSSPLQSSMTHVRYAMETLHLALDDYFGTNKVKVIPNRFLQKKCRSNNKNRRVKKCNNLSPSKALMKKKATTKKSALSVHPF